MNGYSKMRPTNKKTRSMDFMDLLSSPPTQETIYTNSISCTPESPHRNTNSHESSQAADEEEEVFKNKNFQQHPDSPSKVLEEEDENPRSTVVGAVKLMRTCSVAPTSSSPCRFRLERQSSRRTTTTTSGIQSAVKRVLSMRRSSSVSEKYCRIYDQHVTLEPTAASDDDDDDAGATDKNEMKTRSIKTKKKNGILKACRRLLGF